MKVCILGLGYIGFPTACVAASAGHEVVGVDVNRDILNKLRSGGLHISNESGLRGLARDVLDSGRLTLSEIPVPADVFIIAVPTPFRKVRNLAADQVAATSVVRSGHRDPDGHVADLSFVERASADLAPFVRAGSLVILESTVPPGTTENLVRRVIEDGSRLTCGRDFFLAHAPERVLPGNILGELVNNDRVIGGVGPQATDLAVGFYTTFVRGQVFQTDATTAEMVKLMENTYRDVNIALANEFALIAERLGIDVFQAISLANRHPRVTILKPGPGVGGHCIAVDPYFIVEACPDVARVISTAREVNSNMPYHVISLVKDELSRVKTSGYKPRKAAVLGAAYKANVDDDRESPSIEIADTLSSLYETVEIHDPHVARFSARPLDDVLKDADVILLLTDHAAYRGLKPAEVRALVRSPIIIDTRHFFGPEWDEQFRVRRLGVGGQA